MSADPRMKSITATMAVCLAETIEHGGKLVRHQGGYWSWPGGPRRAHDGVPEEYFGTTTVEALVARKRMEWAEWKEGRGGRFPIVAVVVTESASGETK